MLWGILKIMNLGSEISFGSFQKRVQSINDYPELTIFNTILSDSHCHIKL